MSGKTSLAQSLADLQLVRKIGVTNEVDDVSVHRNDYCTLGFIIHSCCWLLQSERETSCRIKICLSTIPAPFSEPLSSGKSSADSGKG